MASAGSSAELLESHSIDEAFSKMIQAFGGGGIPRDELVQHQYDSGLQVGY